MAKLPKKKIVKEKKQCTNCKIHKVLSSFYVSKSALSDGRVDLCKSCIKLLIDYNDLNTIYSTLRQMDIVFDYDLWKASEKADYDTFGSYLGAVNSFIQFRGKSFKDSKFPDDKATSTAKNTAKTEQSVDESQSDFIVSDELIDKWGEGYTPDEIRAFEKKWNKLIDNYGEKTSLHTEGLITYIRFRVKEELATASNDLKGAKQWGDLASAAAKDAKLNVSQLSKSDISGGVDLISQLFEAVESEVGIIPLLPRLTEQPYDDADMIIWSIVNYARRLEDKPPVAYKEVWHFYDDMLEEYYKQQNYSEDQIKEYKQMRNNVFRDLSEVYVEPLYEGEETDG